MRLRECEVIYRTSNHPGVGRTIQCALDVQLLMQSLGAPYRATESMWVVLIGTRNHVHSIHECARGSTDRVALALADIFRAAIIVGAIGIIAVHNHPSGDPAPSADDLAFTTRMRRGGVLLDMKVLDHIILGNDTYFSMCEAGGQWWPPLPPEI